MAGPKFGHPSLSSDIYNYALNLELEVALGMAIRTKIISRSESTNIFKTNSQFTIFAKLFSSSIILTLKANIRILTIRFTKK